MKLIPTILLLFSTCLSWANVLVSNESRTIVVKDLENFTYSEKIILIKSGLVKDYFYIGLRQDEILESLTVYQLKEGKKKKININSLLSESTIDNTSFFSGRKINYFPLELEGCYEISYSIQSKETIFISEFHKNGVYNAVTSHTHIELPAHLQMSTSQGEVLSGSIHLKQSDFLDSLTSMKVLVHPNGVNPNDYFSAWFEIRLKDLSSINELTIPKELLELRDRPREELAKSIFDYVKSKIVYVDIENGINAIVPRDCAFVQKKGRGDCKDMANLMYAYFKYFDFETYLAISKTNSRKEKFDFPSLAEANHMICILYLDANPIFLDATEKECDFRDPSLQIFNTEAFLIGKKPYFLNVSGAPFYKSQASVNLIFEVNDSQEWKAKLSFSACGKSNTLLKSLMRDHKFVDNSSSLGRLLVDLNWSYTSSSVSDSTSKIDFVSQLSKSSIMNIGNSSYIDLGNKLDLNRITYLFYGDTLPTFVSELSLIIQFPGKIKTTISDIQIGGFKMAKLNGDNDSILITLIQGIEEVKPTEWLKIKEYFNSIFNKPIEIFYEKI